jgi:hypothetical protein
MRERAWSNSRAFVSAFLARNSAAESLVSADDKRDSARDSALSAASARRSARRSFSTALRQRFCARVSLSRFLLDITNELSCLIDKIKRRLTITICSPVSSLSGKIQDVDVIFGLLLVFIRDRDALSKPVRQRHLVIPKKH